MNKRQKKKVASAVTYTVNLPIPIKTMCKAMRIEYELKRIFLRSVNKFKSESPKNMVNPFGANNRRKVLRRKRQIRNY